MPTLPPPPPTLASLLVQETQPDILAQWLQICQTIGLPTTAWQAGDPTRALGMLESTLLSTLETEAVGFISAGFLDSAAQPLPDGSINPWLAILAQQFYGLIVPSATYATTSVTLTNSGGGIYEIAPGDLTFTLSVNPGVTYTNTSGGILTGVGSPAATLSVTVIASQAGAASNAGAGEIDTLVTALLGVSCTNPTAATGQNQQDAATTVQQCRNQQSAFSPGGPAGAYSFVALNQALTGLVDITKAREYDDSETGDVTLYIAGASGTVSSSDVAAVQAAVLANVTPLCITPTVYSAAGYTINVAYTLWIYSSVNQPLATITASIQTALQNMFAARPIGGDVIPPASTGALYQSLIEATVAGVYPSYTFRVTITSPAGDITLTQGQIAQLGTVTPTINFVAGP